MTEPEVTGNTSQEIPNELRSIFDLPTPTNNEPLPSVVTKIKKIESITYVVKKRKTCYPTRIAIQ